MLRTGGRLTGRGLAGPCARGDGDGGPRAPREGITRARLRRALGVAAARARSAPAVDQPPRRRGWGSPPLVDQACVFTRTSSAASCMAKAAAPRVRITITTQASSQLTRPRGQGVRRSMHVVGRGAGCRAVAGAKSGEPGPLRARPVSAS